MKAMLRMSWHKLVLATLLVLPLAVAAPLSGLPAFGAQATGGSCYKGDYGDGWDHWVYMRSYVVAYGGPYNYANDHDHYDYFGQRGPLHTDFTNCT